MCKYVGNKKVQNGYATWDPRKNKTGEVPQYDEIPYGDVGPPGVGPQAQAKGFVEGHSGKGQLPQVPAEYSQVPNIPQRQGTLYPWITNPGQSRDKIIPGLVTFPTTPIAITSDSNV